MERLARLAIDRPRAVLAVLAGVSVLAALGLTRFELAHGSRVLVGSDHPSMVRLDRFVETFRGGLPELVAWECSDETTCNAALDATSIRMAAQITAALEATPGVQNVISPSNASLLLESSDGFAVRRLVENGELPADFEALAARAYHDDLWVDHLVSSDGRAAMLYVQIIDSEPETYEVVVDAITKAVTPFEAQGQEFHLAGNAVSSIISGRSLAESTNRIVPLTVVVIAAVLFWQLRTLRLVLAALLSLATALLWTVGTLSWIGWPQDSILQILAPLIMIVGVCDSVHYVARAAVLPTGREHPFVRAARDTGRACVLTTLTTAAALASFATSALDTFVRFGIISAVGVVYCLITTFSVVPLVARAFDGNDERPAPSTTDAWWRTTLPELARFTKRHRRSICLFSLALVAVSLAGAARLRVDTDWRESYGEQSDEVRWMDFIRDRFGSIDTLEVAIRLPTAATIYQPEQLRALAATLRRLETIDEAQRVDSLLDLIRRVAPLLGANQADDDGIGPGATSNAETIELLGFDDPDTLANWLGLDRRDIRVSIATRKLPHTQRVELIDRVDAILHESLPPDWDFYTTGLVAMDADWIRDVQGTQLRSLPTAFVLVLILVTVALGSIPLGLIAMAPTALPIAVTLGAMGWLGMSLDVGRAMLAAVIIGIGVDDAIHLLDAYRRRRLAGLSLDGAVREAVLRTGRAIVTTSVALALGFLTLMASTWQTISSFGFFVSITIVTALVAALLVVPALLYTFRTGDRP